MRFFALIALILGLASCRPNESSQLPYLGQHDFIPEFKNGEMVTDTIYHTIPDFEFVNQNGETITQKNFEGSIYISDFFFTSCPTICPKMSKNMLELAKAYQNNNRVKFLSHSIDTRHDSMPVLKRYAEKLNAPKNWHFVTGNRDEIFDIAPEYLATADEDEHAPGGVVHSGHFILVDAKGRPRAFYDGTKEENLEKIKSDINSLLEELE
jgi:protein SCO1/2